MNKATIQSLIDKYKIDKLKGGIAGFGDMFEKAVQKCRVKTKDQTTQYMESLAEWVITGLTREEQDKP